MLLVLWPWKTDILKTIITKPAISQYFSSCGFIVMLWPMSSISQRRLKRKRGLFKKVLKYVESVCCIFYKRRWISAHSLFNFVDPRFSSLASRGERGWHAQLFLVYIGYTHPPKPHSHPGHNTKCNRSYTQPAPSGTRSMGSRGANVSLYLYHSL